MSRNGHKDRLQIPELENLQVINRHTFAGQRDNSYLYIGRGTPLGNNWSHVTGTQAQYLVGSRNEAVDQYRLWMWQEIQSGKGSVLDALKQIKDRVSQGEKVNLACSCKPEACHGDVVKNAVEYLVQQDKLKTLETSPSAQRTVFISGSRSVTALPPDAIKALDQLIEDRATVLIGDAAGVDTLVQQHLADRDYDLVTVHHIGDQPRNNLGFETVKVDGTRQTDKDSYMASRADSGLAIWDGQSRGTAQNIERLETTVINANPIQHADLSGRAHQAHIDVIAQDPSENVRALYNVPEGLTRGEHASRLNSIDQFTRENFERGATISDTILSIPTDPDARPQEVSRPTIGTEAHAINFVSSFIDDKQQAIEQGQRLYDLADKACGQWTDPHGRWTIFNYAYDSIRKDENGAYRSKDDKAASLDKALQEMSSWAEQLPETTPEPSPEEVHQYTLALAEENRAAVNYQPEQPADINPADVDSAHLLYLHELQSNSHGLATIGELTGLSVRDETEQSQGVDESQLYADMFEDSVLNAMDFGSSDADHLGAERQPSDGRMLDATFERIDLETLPPAIPDTLTRDSQEQLLNELLPRIDQQIESGLSKREILSPIYDANRTAEATKFDERVAQLFEKAGPQQSPGPGRTDQLRALASLRLLVAAEYKRETKDFSREAIQWAKENYYQNPDRLRAAGKLKVGEYQQLVASQAENRTAWLTAHAGQQAPTRSQIARINSLEIAGYKINDRVDTFAPTKVELIQTLDQVQSRIASASLSTENLLKDYEQAEAAAGHLANAAQQFADHARQSDEFQTLHSTFLHNEHERAIDQKQELNRGNNPRFEYLQQTDLSTSQTNHDPDVDIAQVDNDRDYEWSQRNEIPPAEFPAPGSNPILDEHLYNDQRPLENPVFYIPATGTIIEPGIAGKDGVIRGDYTKQTIEEIRERHPDVYIGERATVEAEPQHADRQISNFPELTGDARPLSRFAETSLESAADRRSELDTLANILISPDIERAQAENARELAHYSQRVTELTGREVSNAMEARDALQPTLGGLQQTSDIADSTRTRLDRTAVPQLDQELKPEPVYVSLTGNESVRIPIQSAPEYEALTAAVADCRLNISTWSSLHNPAEITGHDQERGEIARFVGQYVDFRLPEGAHDATALSNRNPLFRSYAQRLGDTRTTEELVELATEIKLENYQFYQQQQSHKLDPATPAPDQKPLDVREMRELFVSVTPAGATKTERGRMQEVLHSMTIFGKEKAERVKLLAEGKIQPSHTLSKLLDNLATRNTKPALGHFYASLQNPAPDRPNAFNLHEAHRSLPQHERDFLYQHALAAKYDQVNQVNKAPAPAPPVIASEQVQGPSAHQTGFYQNYYGQADWMEAKAITEAGSLHNGISAASLQESSIVPELTDLEVRTISHVVNNYDPERQTLVSDHLNNTGNERDQAIGDLIRIASSIDAAVNNDVKEFELSVPENYPLSTNSIQAVVNYIHNDRGQQYQTLAPETLSQIQATAQLQAWQETKLDAGIHSNNILDGPAASLYQVKDLHQSIDRAAMLQDRARTAFQVYENHVAACVAKSDQAIARSVHTLAPAENQKDLTRSLVNEFLSGQQTSLATDHSDRFDIIRQTFTQNDVGKASELREYTALAKNDYLQSFVTLDQERNALPTFEQNVSANPAPEKEALPAAERYSQTVTEIENSLLAEHANEMAGTDALPNLKPSEIQTLTVRDLIPQDVKEATHTQAREEAWQSFTPPELTAAHAGHNVDERLVSAADAVMDKVALSQTLELQVEATKTQLDTFVSEKVAAQEQPLRDERSTTAFESQFRDTIVNIKDEAAQAQNPDRLETAKDLLTKLEQVDAKASGLVDLTRTEGIKPLEKEIILAANTAATTHAQEVDRQSLYASREEQAAAQTQTLNDLTGKDAARYSELRGQLRAIETKYEQSFAPIDEKLNDLAGTRMDIQIERELSQFQQIASPAASAINSYMRDTVKEEGYQALQEPERHEDHVERILAVFQETATAHGISLDQSTQDLKEIATNVFDTLALTINQLHQQYSHEPNLAPNPMLTHSPEMMQATLEANPALSQHAPNSPLHEMAGLSPNGHHDHHQPVLPGDDLNQRDNQPGVSQTAAAHTLTNGPDSHSSIPGPAVAENINVTTEVQEAAIAI